MNVSVDGIHECLQPFGDGVSLRQSVLALTNGEEYKRTNHAVDFGYDNALREETTLHALFISLPIGCHAVDIDGGEERYVLFSQVIDHVVAHASVCHVDDGGRADAVNTVGLHQCGGITSGIDYIACCFQLLDEVGGIAHHACDEDAWCAFFH